jgi:hypothetical protein
MIIDDKSHWSTRYYKMDCPDIIMTMKIDGPDDRSDPNPDFKVECIVEEHVKHDVIRISPAEYEELTTDDDDEMSDAEFIDDLIDET